MVSPSRDQIYGCSRGGNPVALVHVKLPEAHVRDLDLTLHERA